jgi:hypothetical protein
MRKILYISMVFFTVSGIHGMNIPSEILEKIVKIVYGNYSVKHYTLKNDCYLSGLYYAETILPMNLVKESGRYSADLDQPMEDEICYLDTHFLRGGNHLCLYVGTMWVHEIWRYTSLLEYTRVFFDGIGAFSDILMGKNNNEQQGYELAWFKLSSWEPPKEGDFIRHVHRGTLSPFYTSHKGTLNTLTLYPHDDTYIITGKNQSKGFIGHGILGKPPHIIEIHELFEKVLHVTKSTCLGLLQGGRLASIHFNLTGSVEIAPKRVLVKEGSTKEDFFVDLAIDRNCLRYAGTGGVRAPLVALLNKHGEVFEVDLLHVGRPTLFLHSTIETRATLFQHSKTAMQENKRKPSRILYDKGNIGLMFYQEDCGFYDDLEIYPSMSGTACFTKMFKTTK